MGRISMNGSITVDHADGGVEVQEELLGAYQLSLCASFKSRFRLNSSYASVKVVAGPYEGKDLGETECIPCTSNPDWCKIFFLDFLPGDGTILEIKAFDRSGGSTAYKIGSTKVRVEEVLKRKEVELPLSSNLNNLIAIRIEKSMIGTEKDDLAFHLRGLDMNNKEPGPFGLGRSDPFYEISKKDPESEGEWNAVYRSTHINNNLNPMWPKARLGLPELCFGDLSWPLKISVYDYNNKGKHALMGELLTSVAEMQKKISIRGNADRFQAMPITKDFGGRVLHTGYICVLKASMEPPGERKTIKEGRIEGGPTLSSWFCLFLLVLLIALPLIVGIVVAEQEEEVVIDRTPGTTFDSYYLEYERDLNVTLRDGIQSGYLSSLHATSPQQLAFNWLNTQKGDTIAELLQRYAMAVFYFAMDGDNWNQNTTFLSDAGVCEWNSTYGDAVLCNGAGQVTSIRLFNRGLSGALPNELALLFNLKGLYLSRNNITRLPNRIGTLREMQSLYLSHNKISGGIPESMSRLSNLQNLHLQGNPGLTGSLDALCANVNSNFYGAADCKKPALTCSCCQACYS